MAGCRWVCRLARTTERRVVLSSFSPSDHKLATCSDDGTVRIWDFIRCYEEKVLRGELTGQGGTRARPRAAE